MQSVSSMIWTRVAVSISNDDNHYTTGTWVYVITDLMVTDGFLMVVLYLDVQESRSLYVHINIFVQIVVF